MSIAAIIPCSDGAIVAADKRRTVYSNITGITTHDDETKAILIPGTNIVAAAVGQSRFGLADRSVAELLRSCRSKARIQLADELSVAIGKLSASGAFIVHFVECEAGESFVYTKVTTLSRDDKSPSFHIKNHVLQPGASAFFGEEWATSLLSHAVRDVSTTHDEAEHVKSLIEKLIALSCELTAEKNTIGGGVDIFVVRPDSIEAVK